MSDKYAGYIVSLLMIFTLLTSCGTPWQAPTEHETGSSTTDGTHKDTQHTPPTDVHQRATHEKAARQKPETQDLSHITPPAKRVPNTSRYEPPPDSPKTREEAQAIAQHLAALASRDPYVKNAYAVVLGPYAIVGIDVKDDLDRAHVTTTKYTVAQALKSDPYGSRAIVTADPDILTRLQRMNEAIQLGKPLAGIMNELADILARISPQLPSQTKTRQKIDENKSPFFKPETKTPEQTPSPIHP